MVEGVSGGLITEEQKRQFDEMGFVVIKGLFAQTEIEEIKNHFMNLHANRLIPGYRPLSAEESGGDILKQYPRMMNPSRKDELAQSYMLHPKVLGVLSDLFGEEPLAAQDMFYFKPPGARGQALHQDNFFLKVEPGTCIASWIAVDSTDEENGCLTVVPRTHELDIQCARDTKRTDLFAYPKEVPVPEGMNEANVHMDAGDVLFFGGSLIHGSYPNRSQTRFRRAYICHYAGMSVARIGAGRRLVRYDGTVIERELNTDAGPCGGVEVDLTYN